MSKLFLPLVISLFIANSLFSQEFNGHLSLSYGFLNPKLRVQYEAPLKDRASLGVNMNYYFINWRGPVVEPFIRIYGKKDGNQEGFWLQGKLIYGNLSVLDYDLYEDVLASKRWSTFGVGIHVGYKFLIADHFTIEPLGGFRFTTPPFYVYKDGVDEEYYGSLIGEGVAWYLTTGLPVDLQLKFGYQF